MKKYEGDKKKYVGNMKIRPLLRYGPWDLKKFRDHPLFSGVGGGGWFAISRFRGTPEKRHETCQNIDSLHWSRQYQRMAHSKYQSITYALCYVYLQNVSRSFSFYIIICHRVLQLLVKFVKDELIRSKLRLSLVQRGVKKQSLWTQESQSLCLSSGVLMNKLCVREPHLV